MSVTVTLKQVRNQLSQLISRVAFGNNTVVITRFGKPVAAVIKYDDYDRFMNPRKKFIKKSFLENNEKQDKKTPQEKKKAIKETLALAGSWGALDWNEMEKELTRIRHGNKPTPPIELKDI